MFLFLRNVMFGLKRCGPFSTVSPVALLALVCVFCAMSSTDGSSKAALEAVAASNLKFTISIYKILSQQQGNVFFSPLSIEVILALTYMGARGSTASQMARGLQLPDNDELTKQGFHALITSLTSDGNIQLDLANKIFIDKIFTLKKEFQRIAQNSFVSDVESVDFGKDFEATRGQINKWVESKTDNKIKDLLAPGSLSASTSLLLVNAVYFKGDWAIKFDAANTRTRPFHVTPTQKKDVQMMHIQNQVFGYTHSGELGCEILELSYKGDMLSFVVLLPYAKDGLAKLEAKLPEVNMTHQLSKIRSKQKDVWLPKFKLEQNTDLNEVLGKLGMTDMFEDSADFSGLTETPVHVSKVVHKAFIEVNEEGSEAAAATGIFIEKKMMIPDFEADHPFLFLLRERNTGTVLFMGRVSDVP